MGLDRYLSEVGFGSVPLEILRSRGNAARPSGGVEREGIGFGATVIHLRIHPRRGDAAWVAGEVAWIQEVKNLEGV